MRVWPEAISTVGIILLAHKTIHQLSEGWLIQLIGGRLTRQAGRGIPTKPIFAAITMRHK